MEGRPPFDRDDPLATLTAVVTDMHEPGVRAGPALGAVLNGLLDKDPDNRPDPVTLRAMLQTVAADPGAQFAPAARPTVASQPHAGGETVVVAPSEVGGGGPSLAARALAWSALCLVLFGLALLATVVARGG